MDEDKSDSEAKFFINGNSAVGLIFEDSEFDYSFKFFERSNSSNSFNSKPSSNSKLCSNSNNNFNSSTDYIELNIPFFNSI